MLQKNDKNLRSASERGKTPQWRKWTEQERAGLKRYAGLYTIAELTDALGRTERSISHQLSALGVHPRRVIPLWTAQQHAWLREHAHEHTVAELARMFNRGARGIARRLAFLGVRAKRPAQPPGRPRHNYQPWTEEDDSILRRRYKKKGAADTALLLGRTVPAVFRRAQELDVHGPGRHPWRLAELHYIRKRWYDRTAIQIARTLGRTEQMVRHQARKMHLPESTEKRWTAEEDEYLRANIRKIPLAHIALHLGRTMSSINGRTQRLDLRRHFVKLKPKDVAFVLANVGTMRAKEIAAKFGIDYRKVLRIAARHGIDAPREGAPRWTPEDDDKIRTLYGKMPRNALAEQLQRTAAAVALRAIKLGVAKKQNRRPAPAPPQNEE